MNEGTVHATGKTREPLQESILAEYPRLDRDDVFRFDCRPGISCFNCCCADVNIFLSPYDVLRLRTRLGLGSTEFLERYTLLPVQKDMKTPAVLLRMNENEAKTCQFLTGEGCGVYTDRPWPCRMYPLGLAAQKDTPDGWRGEQFWFLLKEPECRGHEEAREWTVAEWLDDQEVDAYAEWGEAYKELTLHDFFADGGVLSPEKLEMFFTATYDLDKFRRFVFESTLLQRFDVDEDFIEQMRYDDEALLRFGFLWLRFSLFGEDTVRARAEVLESYRAGVVKRQTHDTPADTAAEETP